MTSVTLLVAAVHALLLLGLPRLGQTARAGQDAGTFTTRLVAPPAEASPPAPETAPPPSPAPAPAPAPAPRPKAKPTPKPKPKAPATPQSATSARDASSDTKAEAPVLGPYTGTTFGGESAPLPIRIPLPPADAATALTFAQGQGDAPVRIPRAAHLTYRTTGTIGGESFEVPTALNWRQDGRWYDAHWNLYVYGSPIGQHTRTVTGLLTPQGLVPVQATLRTPAVQDVRFDYDAQRVRFAAADAPLQDGMQDRGGVLLQLGALLAGNPGRYPARSVIELPAAHLHDTGRWRFVVEADEIVPALRDRTLPTVRLVHAAQDERDVRIEAWLGRTLDYLPVRLRVTEANGDTVEHTVTVAYTQLVPAAPEPVVAPPEPQTPAPAPAPASSTP